MKSLAPPDRSRNAGRLNRRITIVIIVSNAISIIFAIPALLGLMLLPYVFTAGIGIYKVYSVSLIVSSSAVLAASFCAWIPLSKKRYRRALVMGLLPLWDVFILLGIYSGFINM